jgi:hypothetical protein
MEEKARGGEEEERGERGREEGLYSPYQRNFSYIFRYFY